MSHLFNNCFSYPEARYLVNTHVFERILIGILYYFFRYNTIICNWTALDQNNYILDIFFAYLATANLHYGAFGELVKSLLLFGQVSGSVTITHYKQYGEFVEGLNLIANFQDYKKSGINFNRKNGEVDADRKDIEDDEEDIKDSVIDTKSIIDLNANSANSGEFDKDVGDNIFALPSVVRKKDSDANKSAWEVEKRVKDAAKND